MPAMRDGSSVARPVSAADFTPENIAVAFLIERFKELPRDSFADVVSLVEAYMNPDTPVEEHCEIFETIREILFPQLVGDICVGAAGSIEHTPEKLQRRSDHIGQTIKTTRQQKGLTQTQLAKKSGLPQPHISRLEAGEHSPSFKTLEKIAQALGVTVGDLDPSQ